MREILSVFLFAALLGCFALYLWIIVRLISEAKKRRERSLPLFLFFLLGPLAAVVWLVVRPPQQLAEKRPVDYDSADDALADASRLDTLGDWDQALALYQTSAQRWPEHQAYIERCVEQINKKRSRAASA